jgi:hypothetical protein
MFTSCGGLFLLYSSASKQWNEYLFDVGHNNIYGTREACRESNFYSPVVQSIASSLQAYSDTFKQLVGVLL